MSLRIRHRGLRRFQRRGDASGLTPHEVPRIRRILTALEEASGPEDLDAPTCRLHPLKGNVACFWAVNVTANRRMISRFEGEDVTDVDLLEYAEEKSYADEAPPRPDAIARLYWSTCLGHLQGRPEFSAAEGAVGRDLPIGYPLTAGIAVRNQQAFGAGADSWLAM